MMQVRRVLLRVENIAWMEHYHGREQHLIGSIVPAVELDDAGVIAYVDDRDGEASEFVEALGNLRPVTGDSTAGMMNKVMRELREHASKRLLHGQAVGVRR